MSTQVPYITEIITNNESSRCREVQIGEAKFLLRRSRCEIDKSNVKEYMLLELLSVCGDADLRREEVLRAIGEYARGLNKRRLARMSAYFPARTSKRLIEVGVTGRELA